MNPFFIGGIEDLELFRRPIRDIDFGCFAQIFFGVFLNERKIGIFHGKKKILSLFYPKIIFKSLSAQNMRFIVGIEGRPGGQPKHP